MDAARTREILHKVRQVEIRTNRLAEDSLAGQYHSVFKGKGMDFDEVRQYFAGDDIRAIDWNVTARAGEPFIKKFREERELTIMLLIDISASGEFGSAVQSKREMAAELGSVLAFSALKNNDRVGLILFTAGVELYVPPGKGRRHVLRIVRDILFFEPAGTRTDLVAPLDFLNRVQRRRTVTFLLSDFCLTGDFEANLDTLRPKLQLASKRHDLVAVSVTDPREFELPDVGLLTIEDAETGQQVELDTSSSKVRSAYFFLTDGRRGKLRQLLRRAGIDALELSTERPYLPALLAFFTKREARRSLASA
ncbi:DUF58 domain-containing protein [soil metagenome]